MGMPVHLNLTDWSMNAIQLELLQGTRPIDLLRQAR